MNGTRKAMIATNHSLKLGVRKMMSEIKTTRSMPDAGKKIKPAIPQRNPALKILLSANCLQFHPACLYTHRG